MTISPAYRSAISACLVSVIGLLPAVYAQESDIELEPQEFEIVGRDTRTYEIVGDRQTTVSLVTRPVELSDEERPIESSSGLMPESERLWYAEPRDHRSGLYGRIELAGGSRTRLNAFGRGGYGGEEGGVSLGLINRMTEENTPTNRAPLVQDVDAVAYYDPGSTKLSFGGGFRHESEDSGFRNADRGRTVVELDSAVRMPLGGWSVTGRVDVRAASYEIRDFPYNTAGARVTDPAGNSVVIRHTLDETETDFAADIRLEGRLFGVRAEAGAEGDYMSMGGEHASMSSGRLHFRTLLGDRFSLRVGARGYAYAMPGGDTEVELYPSVVTEWAITTGSYLKGSYVPAVHGHSFSDLFSQNGLLIPAPDRTYPLLYENRPLDAEVTVGFRDVWGTDLALGYFRRERENSPVYTYDAGQYRAVAGVDYAEDGIRGEVTFAPAGAWGVGTTLVYRSLDENIPYAPEFANDMRAWYRLTRTFRLRGTVHMHGEQYTTLGSGATQDGFTTVDIGADWNIVPRWDVYIDVKNIFDAEGSWWTGDYMIPGIGFYVGLGTSM